MSGVCDDLTVKLCELFAESFAIVQHIHKPIGPWHSNFKHHANAIMASIQATGCEIVLLEDADVFEFPAAKPVGAEGLTNIFQRD